MAIAGQATAAFRCFVSDGQLVAVSTTTLNYCCIDVPTAIDKMIHGETVTVRASDMFTVRKLLQAEGVRLP